MQIRQALDRDSLATATEMAKTDPPTLSERKMLEWRVIKACRERMGKIAWQDPTKVSVMAIGIVCDASNLLLTEDGRKQLIPEVNSVLRLLVSAADIAMAEKTVDVGSGKRAVANTTKGFALNLIKSFHLTDRDIDREIAHVIRSYYPRDKKGAGSGNTVPPRREKV